MDLGRIVIKANLLHFNFSIFSGFGQGNFGDNFVMILEFCCILKLKKYSTGFFNFSDFLL